MPCEMCGKDGVKLVKARVEGTLLKVCEQCASFGTRVEEPRPKPSSSGGGEGGSGRPSGASGASGGPGGPSPGASRPPPRKDVLDRTAEKTLREDYGQVIRRAREERDMSQEDLGKKLAEKVSVIKELEGQKMTPPDDLVRKLERTLDIELMEEIEPVAVSKGSTESTGITLGDLIKRESEK